MFQFRRFPSYSYLIHCMMHTLHICGLLHSDICGSFHACWSPQLFAAYHVLHRLPMPRHSPCALISLTIWIMSWISSWFSQKMAFIHFPPCNNCSVQILLCTNYPIWIFRFVSFNFPHLHLLNSYSIFKLQGFTYSFKQVQRKYRECDICRNKSLICSSGHKWTRTIDLTLIRRAL